MLILKYFQINNLLMGLSTEIKKMSEQEIIYQLKNLEEFKKFYNERYSFKYYLFVFQFL